MKISLLEKYFLQKYWER